MFRVQRSFFSIAIIVTIHCWAYVKFSFEIIVFLIKCFFFVFKMNKSDWNKIQSVLNRKQNMIFLSFYVKASLVVWQHIMTLGYWNWLEHAHENCFGVMTYCRVAEYAIILLNAIAIHKALITWHISVCNAQALNLIVCISRSTCDDKQHSGL